jgi:two-component system, OmpR family, alkaline phosphatase synthesis response regulator PhoP
MTRKKILLADDEEDIKTVVRLYLESRGYECLTAYDGLDALSMAESEQPDLILLDVMMPVMDGYEVARKLKASEKTRGIPIIMLSAAGHSDSIKKGLEAGARDYLVKPFEPSKLDELIQTVLQ